MRTEPKQDRARRQIQAIEDAARIILRTKGRDEFTTGDIAEVADISIGTIYRYFPNRVAVLDRVWPDRRDTNLPSKRSGS